MFEAHVSRLLKKYLGDYVEGLSAEALRISVWNGDVMLKDLKLKAEALNSLKLPVTVKAGFVGNITIKVPWKSLGKDPVIVLIDRVFVLAEPAPDGQHITPEDREKLFEAKLQQIEEREATTLEATSGYSKDGLASFGTAWVSSLTATVLGNLKVTISNVHIRLEDSVSNPGHPFCSGITLSRLAAVTVDEKGNETFDTSAALDKLRKSVQLHRLAVYHDSDSTPWKIDKKWEDLNPAEWNEIFQDGIDERSPESNSVWASNRQYLVSPINGVLKYQRLGKEERGDPNVPFVKASLLLADVSSTITEAQYYNGIKLLETFSRFKTRVEVSHLRPVVPILDDPRAWWRYSMLASLRQKKSCYFFSWERIKDHCQLRRQYVQLYATSLQQPATTEVSELRQIERVLDSKVIILWRLLAHAKVESVKLSRKKASSKKSWWPLAWSSGETASGRQDISVEPVLGDEEKLTKEEWQAINKLISYHQQEDDTLSPMGKLSPDMIISLVDISITQAAARIINIDGVEVLCGRFEYLHVATKLYSKSICCDVSLKFCGLSSPEGPLAQSVVSERKSNALVASFVHAPLGEDLDWKLSATIAPCHVTVSMVSYERFLEFVKRSNAISPRITMETATALQSKFEQVTRKAQEQFQIVLEEQSRFGLDIDLDAPKVWIPLRAAESSFGDGHFILDFGHFTLHTGDGPSDDRQSMYSHFYVSGRDMAVFFSDSMSMDRDCSGGEGASQARLATSGDDSGQVYSILDPCGMSLIFDQIKIPHPRYPSSRISVQVPNLGLHFSPERYRRIIELMDLFYNSKDGIDQDGDEADLVPWHPADLTTNARILVWRGIGNSMAEWHPCYLALSGFYLYVLESELARTYQRCCSMAGRHIFEVPPASVGGSLYAIAVSSRGLDVQKALESTSTLIIEFPNDAEKAIWMKELVQVTYRASAPADMYIPGGSADSTPTGSPVQKFGNLGSADFVLNGTVVETKLSVYGKLDRKSENAEEVLILKLLGNGAKVNLARYTGDLTIKTKLHSLKIEDMLQGPLSLAQQYLLISVVNEELPDTDSPMLDSEVDQSGFIIEEDSFKDALMEFTPTPTNQGFSLPGSDMAEVYYEATDDSGTDFVALTFITRSPDYHLYDGIDTQMSIRMTAMEFYCNRPTVVALIDFGLDVSMVNYGTGTESNTATTMPTTPAESIMNSSSGNPKSSEKEEITLIKGLLGHGKGRVIFDLKMDVDQVSVFLNKEESSQLAMFVQERFLFDLKVHPSSISINGTLGNTRLCDMSLGPDHQWGWLCDTRKEGIESLIEYTFQSYSADDDDYDGYDYSLTGQLSAVRIVFLYRFVQEFMSYFMELASPHTEEAIKLIDKVGGFEWLIQKYEIDGSTAVKLDLSLDTPIIIVPKNSNSKDYMQLDLGKLKVKNTFSWHGNKDSDPSAVHLDILHAEIDGINMAVGVGGTLGKPMIREGQSMLIEVRRSLRDVFRKVPTMAIEVQVPLLHGVMSDKEYNVISTCLSMNLCELPNLPPSFRENPTETKESIRMLADKVNLKYNSQLLLSRTVFVIGVDIKYALLELLNGPDAESPLAQIALEGLWVSYRTTSLLEMDLFVSIPKFFVLDIRPDTKPEMQLMLGSDSCDNSKPKFGPQEMSLDTRLNSNAPGDGTCNLTMLIMDYRCRTSFQSFVIRIQQPHVLVVLDFLLAVVEYFVPSLGMITGREEAMDPKNDPLTNSDDIIVHEPVFKQSVNIVYLSPARQLIVDGVDVEEFVYDGCGGVLSLSDEFERKGQWYSGDTVIMIGPGKSLRFKNVKIENGALLRKCTYLNNGSSFSVAEEDGVEISLLDSSPSNMEEDHEGHEGSLNKGTHTSEKTIDSASTEIVSFSFEAQVVSPEFTFYDSSKLLIDDSLQFEKLLRAKLDFSFMYASKGNDVFSRAIVKDLTVEAGSGLVVIEPVDVSGGYTSVKDKTSVIVSSTDICIHLSLAVASLLLKLQNQTMSALQFGNISPLVSCTNFERIWVSPKGGTPGYNLTFWRPQAPPGYAILGDCVTSRPVPPTQVVVAVSNTYGRVRKATGFTLICTLPGSESENDCSIWLPIPPPGYSAIGCVAHVGRLPPPNHFVYCLRLDLVTSTKFSDCISYVPAQQGFPSGLSVWRVDNVLNSFYTHNSVEVPPQGMSLDLHQILLRNPKYCTGNVPDSTASSKKEHTHQSGEPEKGGSVWDVVRSKSKSSSYYTSTPQFERIWWDKGCDVRRPVSIWRPIPRPGFAPLGDCITEGLEPPALGLVFKCDNSSMFSARPNQFTQVAQIIRKGGDDAYFWYPVPPPGYTSVGCVVTRSNDEPRKDSVCCPRIDLVSQTNVSAEPISRSSSSKGSNCWSIWRVENQASTFLARPDHKKPSAKLAYSISDFVKPKARENVVAEFKLGFLSVSILDSSCGTVTPMFDATVTNINLASQGRYEAMNAVVICSIAASTFNRQLEAWEPLIEPFDGIFKLETYDVSEHPPKVGKRIRVAATTPINLNVSAANLETLIETAVSWSRQNELEAISSKRSEEAREKLKKSTASYSALNEDDFQKIIIENKLGCDVYFKRVEDMEESIGVLSNESQVSLFMPPPRFADKLNVVPKQVESRYYVAIQILESKGLPIKDDGNNHDYFCALRLLMDSTASEQYKLFPQSARTRCVKPLIFQEHESTVGYAKWNELFIFEVPEKGSACLEIEVTNLASRAGKGEVIGSLSVPVGRGMGSLKRAPSIKVLHHASDFHQATVYRLMAKGQRDRECGILVLSTCFIERNNQTNFNTEKGHKITDFKEIGFWIGLSDKGPWESFGSVLPLSVVPKSLNDNHFAFDVSMRDGMKYATLRALAMVCNDSDVKLELSLCPSGMINRLQPLNSESSVSNSVVEEVFENQRYQPISGWGNKSSSPRENESWNWSNREFSHLSKDFFEPPLPAGWRWTSPWRIEKSQFVDKDGWAYGTELQAIRWPPISAKSSSKSQLDSARRRRWIRTREKFSDSLINSSDRGDKRKVIGVINPRSSIFLPWTSMIKGMDLCLQIRPLSEKPQESYSWGQALTVGPTNHSVNQQSNVLSLAQLKESDMLFYCTADFGVRQTFWLSAGVDASALQTELNEPVPDWKISVNSVFRLENKLPYEAEYAIWEKTGDGSLVERQHGIVASGGCACIYSADMRKSVYMTMFVQGGWTLEKEVMLIWDPQGINHVSSFWMVQKQTKRRLRVSVERDTGRSNAAPKTVRIFVPYWIRNDSALHLSYRIVEVEPLESTDTDSQLLTRAVKSAKLALRYSSKALDRRGSSSRRNVQILESIEDSNPNCIMLSPQDYLNRSVVLPFQSRGDTFATARVGISVAIGNSTYFSPGISLLELETKERIDIKAFGSDGSYYGLTAQLKMASDRTKVVHFLPRVLFINRIGRTLSLSQSETTSELQLGPTDSPQLFRWQPNVRSELLKVQLDGYKWSTPFSIESDGVMCISMNSLTGSDKMFIRVQVRIGAKKSRYEVVFQLASLSSPYRIENRSMYLPLRFRQVDGYDDSWRSLPPNSASLFFWEDLGRSRMLELMVDGSDSSTSYKYSLDEASDRIPSSSSSVPKKPLRVTVFKEGKMQVNRVTDWMPETGTQPQVIERVTSPIFQPSEIEYGQSSVGPESEVHMSFELAELGLSIIDHMPEEILYLSVQKLFVSYSSGMGSGISRFKARMYWLQADNQLPFSPMPVLFSPLRVENQPDYIIKLSVTTQANNSLDLCVYPYIGLQAPENSFFLVNIHEPIIWRLHDMIQHINIGRLSKSQTAAVSVDPMIKIGLLNISEIRFRVSMAMSPAQRPRGVLGFWASLMTALGNMEHMPVRITQRFRENVSMRQSALTSTAFSNIQKDLVTQPLQLLSGVDILGNASSALSNMSKGIAALSMDKKFIQSRQKQDSKGVEDISDVIREGGGALAKGFFRGVTGILTKPLEGAKATGVEGFVSGVGKGLIGAAAQPVSGVLDLLSKTTEGANAVKNKISSAIMAEEQLTRRRLPRAIGGDNLLRPFDEYKAAGQAILQLAECGTFLGQVDLFKVRGKFAFTDAYEDHHLLPKGKVLLVTHHRVLLLQQPTLTQRKFNPAKDPCTVLWEVPWDELVTMELTRGKKDNPGSLPSHLILYLRMKPNDNKEGFRIIKCTPGSEQATKVYVSIQQALDTYGPSSSKELLRRKVPKPYNPHSASSPYVFPKEIFGGWGMDQDGSKSSDLLDPSRVMVHGQPIPD
ncbi:hypothetical protein LUZ63_005511 [Rhynchospora breviuscula]|uniref:C2 domain-containing protein n=1 Tax=Rhynchospora breviuscula TaxID=2022672 RepID=A0A9Q0CMZ9_9POAL|nr:hypothetical protein LUZ63_005511 [Rhynchospora breviuscula]